MNSVQEMVLTDIQKIISDLNDARTTALMQELGIGKMVRARLILEIAGEQAITLASVVELIHLASLLHDDVIDKSDARRGKPTVNALYGAHTAVMLGDILYSSAFAKLVQFGPDVASKVATAVSRLSIGELADVALGDNFNTDKAVYEQMIYDKTASLIEAACYGAAKLAGFDADAFAKYGKSLGIAFQLIDDLLDIFSDEQTLGKPAFSDFKEGKTTIAYMKLYDALAEDEKQKLTMLFKQTPSDEDKKWLMDAFKKHDIKAICEKEASNVMIEGLAAISNSDAPQELKIKLEQIAAKQLGRTF